MQSTGGRDHDQVDIGSGQRLFQVTHSRGRRNPAASSRAARRALDSAIGSTTATTCSASMPEADRCVDGSHRTQIPTSATPILPSTHCRLLDRVVCFKRWKWPSSTDEYAEVVLALRLGPAIQWSAVFAACTSCAARIAASVSSRIVRWSRPSSTRAEMSLAIVGPTRRL